MAMTVEDLKIGLEAADDARQVTEPEHSVFTVATVSKVAVAARTRRSYLLLINDSDEVIYLALGTAAALNSGIRLNSGGGSYEMAQGQGNLYIGAIHAICTSGGKKLLVTESTEG